jgi:hypothetical protein
MSSAAVECLALVASICLTGPAKIEIERSTLWVGASLEIADVRVRSTLSSDSVSLPNRKHMERRCNQARCFYYSGICEKKSDSVICILYYEINDSGMLQDIEISGPSVEAMNSALQRALFVPYPNAFVRFDSLNFRFNSPSPICLPRRDGSCPQ